MAARKPKAEAAVFEAAPALTSQDAHNILQLLNRVQTTGIQEAQVLGILAHKLTLIRGPLKEENVQDDA